MADENNCKNCPWRAKYDSKPKSLLGRLWRWHIGFCPGWREYMKNVSDEKRKELVQQYSLKMIL